MDVGWGGHCVVGQTTFAAHTDVQPHAKVPLLALARWVHVRVTGLIPILGGARCTNDGGIQNGAGVELEALALQDSSHLGKQGLAQFVVIEEFAKLQDCGGIRHRLTPQVIANEAIQTHTKLCCSAMARVCCFICIILPVLPWTRQVTGQLETCSALP